jgi:PPOX class probable FMN-dependent enzyme
VDARHAVAGDRFQDVITTESQLREFVGRPNRWLTSKMLSRLNQKCRQFIAMSPFVVVGSAGGRGTIDLSPKGDPPGFVRVLDDSTLAVPDRAGNRRVDTFLNILQNPHVGLLFFVPGKRETLRVFGCGFIVRDVEVRNAVALAGHAPDLALVVAVERAFFHCGRCVTRSGLWAPFGGTAEAAEL